MKQQTYQPRVYRRISQAEDLYSANIVVKDTDLQVSLDKPPDTAFLKDKVLFYRRLIEDYIQKDPRFLVALKPLAVELTAPPIVKQMAGAAQKAGVGPMAAVAGSIAEFLGRQLMRQGHREVIIENGGDIFLASSKERRVGIYSGRIRWWKQLQLKIIPEASPLGICTSSGTVGHSLSFGSADSVVILAKSACLADAVATATCNRVGAIKSIEAAINYARSIREVKGVVIIHGKHLASWGKVELVA